MKNKFWYKEKDEKNNRTEKIWTNLWCYRKTISALFLPFSLINLWRKILMSSLIRLGRTEKRKEMFELRTSMTEILEHNESSWKSMTLLLNEFYPKSEDNERIQQFLNKNDIKSQSKLVRNRVKWKVVEKRFENIFDKLNWCKRK